VLEPIDREAGILHSESAKTLFYLSMELLYTFRVRLSPHATAPTLTATPPPPLLCRIALFSTASLVHTPRAFE
jgi:hypothetical protein